MHGPESPTPVRSDASGWHRPTSAAEDPYARYGLGHDYGPDFAAAQESARFWHQVGDALDKSGIGAIGGGVLVGGGAVLLIVSGPVGWGAGVVYAMMIAGGTASVGIGVLQLGLHATAAGTPQLQAEMGASASFARGISSPGVLVCGAVGAGIDGEEGLSTGMAVGGAAETIVWLVPVRMLISPAGGASGITRGSQVTEQMIRDAMKGAPLSSQQVGGVSLPMVQRYVDKLLAGEVAPAIKVDGKMIVDGNHRYIAGKILGQEPAIQPWVGGRPESAVSWETIPIDRKDW